MPEEKDPAAVVTPPEEQVQGTGQDTSTVSPEALAEAERAKQQKAVKPQQATTADGTQVTVGNASAGASGETEPAENPAYTVNLKNADGSEFNLEFSGDVRITRSADATSVYFSDTNKTRLYTADGTFSEIDGYFGDENANSIYVSTRDGSSFTAGNGDNLFFVYGDNTSIEGGSGNDTVVITEGTEGHVINTGEGNDKVTGKNLDNSSINLGGGNNTLDLGLVSNSTIAAGDGHNTLKTGALNNTAMVLGSGNNAITVSSLYNDSSIVAGDGNNTLQCNALGRTESVFGPASSANVLFGSGDNNVKIYEMLHQSALGMGNGNNTVDIYELEQQSSLIMGDGNNNVKIYETEGSSTVAIGNGNNRINIYELEGQSSLTIGGGNNTLKIYETENSSSVTVGNGNNSMQLYAMLQASVVSAGGGNNSINVYEVLHDSTLTAGDGHNALTVGNIKDNASVAFGNGDNDILIGGLHNAASAIFGHGNNLLRLYQSSAESSVRFGDGKNRVISGQNPDASILAGSDKLEIFSLRDMSQEDYLEMMEKFEEQRRERLGLDLPVTPQLEQGLSDEAVAKAASGENVEETSDPADRFASPWSDYHNRHDRRARRAHAHSYSSERRGHRSPYFEANA